MFPRVRVLATASAVALVATPALAAAPSGVEARLKAMEDALAAQQQQIQQQQATIAAQQALIRELRQAVGQQQAAAARQAPLAEMVQSQSQQLATLQDQAEPQRMRDRDAARWSFANGPRPSEGFWFGVQRRASSLSNPRFHGWHVQGSWVLTGEPHRYSMTKAAASAPGRSRCAFPIPTSTITRGCRAPRRPPPGCAAANRTS